MLVVGFTIGEQVTDINLLSILTLLAKIVGFTLVTWVLSSRVVPPLIVLLKRSLHVPQLSFGLLTGGLFVVVGISESLGAHGSLGRLALWRRALGSALPTAPGYRAGHAECCRGFVRAPVLRLGGLHLSLSFTDLPIVTILALVSVPLVGKFAGSLVGAFVSRLEMPFALATGLMAKGVAEIALLLVLLEIGIIGDDVFSLLVLIMFAYILLAPSVINYAINRTRPSEKTTLPGTIPASLARFALDDITVNDILDRTRSYPKPHLTVRSFVDRWITPQQHDYLVVENGTVSGIVSLGMLRYLPKEAWSTTRLESVVRRKTPVARPDEPVEDVLQRMTENSLTVIPVVEEESEEFLGMVTSQDVLDLITLEARGAH